MQVSKQREQESKWSKGRKAEYCGASKWSNANERATEKKVKPGFLIQGLDIFSKSDSGLAYGCFFSTSTTSDWTEIIKFA